MPPKASTKRKAANGYRLPDPLPEGLIITAITKKSWRLGKSIGVGGFGEIYLCSDDISRPVGDEATMALKIEPHENGPLFVEMNFYIRAARPESVEEFQKARKLKSLGMPCHRGSGSHIYKDDKYRFLVMDRFGKDLQKIFQTGKKLFSPRVTFNLAIKVIDVLEYIHSKGYVHNDIKAQNLLLGYGRTKENDIYLVDFGLVSKYQRDGVHLEYKPDARKAHDGTIEYTSRDAHIGAHSRRSDLEILGYNLVHWMSGTLPWMDNLTNPKYVHAQKKGFMNDIRAFLQRCFVSDDYPEVLEEFLTYVEKLEFDTEPDYAHCRKMFEKALVKNKFPLDGKIDFSTPKQKASAAKKSRKRKRSEFEDIDIDIEAPCRKSTRNVKSTTSDGRTAPHPTPAASPTPDTNSCDNSNHNNMVDWSWERVLCSDPEMLIRRASRQSETEDESPLAMQHRALDEKRQQQSLQNPTPAMLEIIQRIEEREREREQMTWQQQLQHLTGGGKKLFGAAAMAARNSSWDLTPNPLTPAMEEVINMRQKRISVEIDVPITPGPSDSDDSDSDDDGGDSCSSHEEYVPPGSSSKKRSDEVDSSRKPRRPQPTPNPVYKHDFFDYSQEKDIGLNVLNVVRHKPTKTATTKVVDPDNPFLQLVLGGDIQEREKCLDSLLLPNPDRQVVKRGRTLEKKKRGGAAVKTHVSVQNDIGSPNKIRNKGSPDKFPCTGNNGIMVMENNGTTPSKPKQGRRRISVQNDATPIRNKDSPPDQQFSLMASSSDVTKKKAKKMKERFVLTNNDCSSKGTPKAPPPSNAKRLSSIPEEVFIESVRQHCRTTTTTTTPSPIPTTTTTKRGRGRPPKPKPKAAENEPAKIKKLPGRPRLNTAPSSSGSINGIANAGIYNLMSEGGKKVLGRKKTPPTTTIMTATANSKSLSRRNSLPGNGKMLPPSSAADVDGGKHSNKRMTMRSAGSSMRTTRAQDWNWGSVLLSNPEKMIRRK